MRRKLVQADLRVVHKEKELQMKFTQLEQQNQLQTLQLKSRIDQLIAEHSLVKKNYEAQIRMLSDHIIELSSKKDDQTEL